mmetsp:Transcript_97454/g.168048  ORF Transcript_97454/g.168048 Transcript_97454/m.168048 type:complete len:279 (+) Transcript_97454:3358-4194(+)
MTVFSSAMVSPQPTLKDVYASQWLTTRCTLVRNHLQRSGPYSLKMMCTRLPDPLPTAFLSAIPMMSSPCLTTVLVSMTERSLSSSRSGCSLANPDRLTGGIISENNCFPVHRGPPGHLRMAGTGTTSKLGTCISTFIIIISVTNVSRFVSRLQPRRESWTIPIHGELACGVMMFLGTIIMWTSSVLVSRDWGRCRFISSPSKSALYGDVTERFSRNVEYGSTLARCPIIDIRCSVGCRLNSTQSPSFRCRSTMYPGSRCTSLVFFTNWRFTLWPSSRR